MNEIQIVLKKIPAFILCYAFVRYFRKFHIARRIAILVFAALAVGSVAGSAVAQQGFALIGAWRHSEPATQSTPAFTITQVFNADGKFNVQEMIAPRPGMVGVVTKWLGSYRATGATSFVYQVQAWQSCSSGGACQSCPGTQQACILDQQGGVEPGIQKQASVQMRGPNQIIDQYGQAWFRVR
jgi:hypothetical protein